MRPHSQFDIGVATVDITPPLGIRLAGYGSRTAPAEAVEHPLRAEALVCKSGAGAWALVASDTIGYPRDFVIRVRDAITRAVGLPPQAIMISATHTHSGPAAMRTYSTETTPLETAYCNQLEASLVGAVSAAFKHAEPGHFEVAHAKAPDLASNRRVVQADGSCANEWQDPEGKHEGYYDCGVSILAVVRPDGRRDALVVNYGCHPVTFGPGNLRISADYPGYVKDYLEAHGVARTVLFTLAGAGNINPRRCIQTETHVAREMGDRLGQIILCAVGRLRRLQAGAVAFHSEPWSFVAKRDWREGSGRAKGEAVETEIQALRAGDLGLLAVPGELFSEYVARFRGMWKLPELLVVSVANDSVGYLPVDAAIPQGGHEVRFAAAEGLEQGLLERASAALSAVGG